MEICFHALRTILLLALVCFSVQEVGAQTPPASGPQDQAASDSTEDSGPDSHSDSGLPDAPGIAASASNRPRRFQTPSPGDRATRPFRSLAVGLTLGTAGVGVELATPVTSKVNLRASAGFLSFTTSFTVDTIPIDGTLHLGSLGGSVDWFPTAGSFHLSPGITVYNDKYYNARIFIPGNQVVTLNDQDYTSDPNDPIHGTAFIQLANTVAPRFTLGWGNVIRHRTAGFTFPVELGIEFIKPPTAAFSLSGSSCDSNGDCGPIQDDPSTQQNINEQQSEIISDLRPLRFFPIFSIGISYKFGH